MEEKELLFLDRLPGWSLLYFERPVDRLNNSWTVPLPGTMHFMEHATLSINQNGEWNTIGTKHILQLQRVINVAVGARLNPFRPDRAGSSSPRH